MKRLFKRSATVLLVLVLIFAMTAMSVSAFVPPGQAKKLENAGMQRGWGNWIDWDEIEDEYDEEDFIGLPPGIAKKGIPLPPGLMKRLGNLPPGIQNRFMNTEVWRHGQIPEEYDPVVKSITLDGQRTLTIPETGSYLVTYTAKVLDQYNKVMKDESVAFSLNVGTQGSLTGISIDGTYSLHVDVSISDKAVPGRIFVKAISDEDSNVTASLNIDVVEADEEVVFSETSLRAAVNNEEIEVITLGSSITLEDPLVINRDVTIEGNGFSMKAEDEFDGWLLVIREGNEVTLNNLLLDGRMDDENDQDDLDGLVKVEEGAVLETTRNRLRNASIGFALWVDEDDFDEEELVEMAENLIDNNRFRSLDIRVIIYNEDDDVIYEKE